ncbi:hypothetical protein OQA88_10693 [Cercophora sp. LCS_1]
MATTPLTVKYNPWMDPDTFDQSDDDDSDGAASDSPDDETSDAGSFASAFASGNDYSEDEVDGGDSQPKQKTRIVHQPLWVKKQREFWNTYLNDPSALCDWHTYGDQGVMVELYQIYQHLRLLAGKYQNTPHLEKPYELLSRLVLRPFYECLVDFTKIYRRSDSIDMGFVHHMFDQLLKPWEFLNALKAYQLCDVFHVITFIEASLVDEGLAINKRILEDAAPFMVGPDHPAFGRPQRFLKGGTMPTGARLNNDQRAHEGANGITGWRSATNLDVSQVAVLGVQFFNRLRSAPGEGRRRRILLKVVAALPLSLKSRGFIKDSGLYLTSHLRSVTEWARRAHGLRWEPFANLNAYENDVKDILKTSISHEGCDALIGPYALALLEESNDGKGLNQRRRGPEVVEEWCVWLGG